MSAISKKIYLSRHGITRLNGVQVLTGIPYDECIKKLVTIDAIRTYADRHGFTLDQLSEQTHEDYSGRIKRFPAADQLTPRGEKQAEILGKYINTLGGNSLKFVTSDKKRAFDTARIAAEVMGYTLDSENLYRSEKLNEEIPREFFTEEELRDPSPWLARRRSALDITLDTLMELITQTVSHEGDIFAVLHGARNFCLIQTVRGLPFSRVEEIQDNCSVTILDASIYTLRVMESISYSKMESQAER